MRRDEGVAVQAGLGLTRRSVLLTALSLLIGPKLPEAAAMEHRPMEQDEQELTSPTLMRPQSSLDLPFSSADGDSKPS
jgi:hypothetical protein